MPNLTPFHATELQQLEKEYHLSKEELASLLQQYHYSYWYYYYKYQCFLKVNILYLGCQVLFCKDGLQSFVRIFHPGLSISDSVGYGIGIPMALLDYGFNTSVYSCQKEAVKSTLQYAKDVTFFEKCQQIAKASYENPMAMSKKALQFLGNYTLLLTHNLTGSFTYLIILFEPLEILGKASVISFLATPLKWATVSAVLYFGNGHYSLYSNPDYFKGLAFWRNEQKRPWLIQEIWRGNIAVPLQIIIQGLISTVGIRSFPNYYYYALAAANALGGWIPATIVAIFAAGHNLCVRYPTTYYRYLENREKTFDLLKTFFQPNIECLWNLIEKKQSEELAVTLKQWQFQLKLLDHGKQQECIKQLLACRSKDSALATLVHYHHSLLEKTVLETKPWHFVFSKEKTNIVPLLYRSLIGGYLGYFVFAPLVAMAVAESLLVTSMAILLGVAILGGSLYLAEQKRVTDTLINDHLKNTLNPDKTQVDALPPANLSADILNISSQTSRAMSTMGSGTRLFGDNPIGMTTTGIIVIEQAINGFIFNMNKLRSTFQVKTPVTAISSHPATLFSRKSASSSRAAPSAPAGTDRIKCLKH